ncbi:MAG: hypothetical protein ACOC2U_04925 [bacterium]
MSLNQKGVIPVVVVALLMLVSIILAVVTQNWFNDLTSRKFAEIDPEDDLIIIIRNVSNNYLYVELLNDRTLNLKDVMIGGSSCSLGTVQISKGINSIDLGTCSTGKNEFEEVVLISNEFIYSEVEKVN